MSWNAGSQLTRVALVTPVKAVAGVAGVPSVRASRPANLLTHSNADTVDDTRIVGIQPP
jgi:hypothetical protein